MTSSIPTNMADTMAGTMADTGTRCGFVALIGAPNAGKSTLTNQLVGAKVAIVTHKVQTTRNRIVGIGLEGQSQLVFIDTPGIFQPGKRFERAMVQAAWKGSEDAEMTLLVVDARKGIYDQADHIAKSLAEARRPAILVLNKIDQMKRDTLLALIAHYNSIGHFEETFMVSALTGDGVDDLKTYLATHAPEGPWMYPEDQISDMTLRLMAEEITREKIFLRLHDELPYATTIETEAFEERNDGSFKIEQVIHVERDTQKAIAIGRGGQMLKTIGQMAREDMEEAFDCKVHLFLHVRVTERWADDKDTYTRMGLDYVD